MIVPETRLRFTSNLEDCNTIKNYGASTQRAVFLIPTMPDDLFNILKRAIRDRTYNTPALAQPKEKLKRASKLFVFDYQPNTARNKTRNNAKCATAISRHPTKSWGQPTLQAFYPLLASPQTIRARLRKVAFHGGKN